MKNIFESILIGTFAILIICSVGCGGDSGNGGSTTGSVPVDVQRAWEGGDAIPIAKNHHTTTAKGVHVYSRAGLSAEHLTQVDSAFDELFEDVKVAFPGEYDPITLVHSNYAVYEPNHDCRESPIQRIPAMLVRDGALSYDGTQYDQYDDKDEKSVVLAPERVFGLLTAPSIPRQGAMIVCPDLRIWKDGVRFGTEHIIGESGSGSLFSLAVQARVHSSIVHPFIPRRSAGLKAEKKPDWSEFAPLK